MHKCTSACLEEMSATWIFGLYTPSGYTDCCSPVKVDYIVGETLKKKVSSYYEEDFKNSSNWRLAPTQGGLQALERLVHMARWLAKAWRVVRQDSQ